MLHSLSGRVLFDAASGHAIRLVPPAGSGTTTAGGTTATAPAGALVFPDGAWLTFADGADLVLPG